MAGRTSPKQRNTLSTMATEASTEAELQAWREAHEHLSKAILVAKEAVAVAKAQRRYWLEEVCANLTPEGKLVINSVWKKPMKVTRKTPPKRKPVDKSSSTKRKRKADATGEDAKNPKKAIKRKDWQKSMRLTLKVPKTEAAMTPHDVTRMSMAQMYGDHQGSEETQRPAMSPMQTAQSDTTPAFPQAVRQRRCLLHHMISCSSRMLL